MQFDGIFRNANIWINSFFVGNNFSGYLGAVYDVTNYINFDKDNIITVRVDATQYEGWFYEGAGIYRHVWLRQNNNLHITDGVVFVHAEVQSNNAIITAETTVENKNFALANLTVTTYIATRDGKQVAEPKPQLMSLAVNT